MKAKKAVVLFFVAILVALLICACGQKTGDALVGITVESQPTKTEYLPGEEIDLSGLKLNAVYGDGSGKEIAVTADMTDAEAVDMSVPGQKKVTVTYTEGEERAEAWFLVEVLAPSEIQIDTSECKAMVGESVDLNDLQIIVKYPGGKTQTVAVSEDMITSDVNTAAAGVYTVRVTYLSLSEQFSLTVIGAQSAELKKNAAKSAYYVGETLSAEGLKLILHLTDGTTEEFAVTEDMLDLSGIDFSVSGNKSIPVSMVKYGLEVKVNWTVAYEYTAEQLIKVTRDNAKAELAAVYGAYNKDDFYAEDYETLTALYRDAVAALEAQSDVTEIQVLTAKAKNDMGAILSMDLVDTDLAERKADYIADLKGRYDPDNYSGDHLTSLNATLADHTTKINAVAITADRQTALEELKAAYEQAINALDAIALSCLKLVDAVPNETHGYWSNQTGELTLSDNMPEGVEGKSAPLTNKNQAYQFICASYMLREPLSSAELFGKGNAAIGFWFYISDVSSLGENNGFWIAFNTGAAFSDGGSSGRYNIGNATADVINLSNGFVSGWNYIEIPASRFDNKTVGDFTHISFGIRVRGEKSTADGRTNYPAQWKEGTEVLVTDFRIIYDCNYTKLTVVEAQPNALHTKREAAMEAMQAYRSEEWSNNASLKPVIEGILAEGTDAIWSADNVDATLNTLKEKVDVAIDDMSEVFVARNDAIEELRAYRPIAENESTGMRMALEEIFQDAEAKINAAQISEIEAIVSETKATLDAAVPYTYKLLSSDTLGVWKDKAGIVTLSDNMPAGVEGHSAALGHKNSSYMFVSSGFMMNESVNSSELHDAPYNQASLGFWFYISDLSALGEKTGFFICFNSNPTATAEGTDAGRYNVGNAPVYITAANGFVNGWNYIEIPNHAFDSKTSADFTQISFGLRCTGEKSTLEGKSNYPAEWVEGTQILVTGLRWVYDSTYTGKLNVVQTQDAAIVSLND